MSKYCGWVDGKAYDFKYQKCESNDGWYNIYLGKTLICQTIKSHRNTWSVVVLGPIDNGYEYALPPRLVEGFATRWDAIQYALKTHHATRKSYNR